MKPITPTNTLCGLLFIRPNRYFSLLAMSVAALGSAQQSQAATKTWEGDTSTAWATAGNWDTAPLNDLTTDIANFNLATYDGATVFAPTAPNFQKINGITIGGTSGAVTITTGTTANRLQIGASGITMAAGAGALSLGGATATAGVLIAANQTWTNDSSSALGWNAIGTPNSSGNLTLTLSGTGSGGFSQLQNGITQGTSSTLAIVVDYAGSGTVSMIRATNTFSGGLTIKQGTVLVNIDNGTGAGTVTLGVNEGAANATLTSANAGSARVYASAFVLATGHTGNLTIGSTGSGNATFTGGVTGTNNLIVDSNNSVGNIQFTTTGLNFTGNLTKTGAGIATLTANNTHTGTTIVNGGTLALGNVNAVQSSTLDTGTSGSQLVTFTVAGSNTYNIGGLQGADALAIGNNTISVGANNASTTISGAISGTLGKLTKVGSGTLTLSSASNGYTGATQVTDGTLLVNGNISTSMLTTVKTGATLGGTGTVGALTIDSGGFHNPGNSPGIQKTGNYSMAGTLGIEINGATVGTNYDQINTTGTVSLSGLLSVTMGYTPAEGQLFFILANDDTDAITGTFSNAGIDGNTYTLGGRAFQISYFGNQTSPGAGAFTGGNDVVLMAIPEPRAALLGGLGLLTLLRRRRA